MGLDFVFATRDVLSAVAGAVTGGTNVIKGEAPYAVNLAYNSGLV